MCNIMITPSWCQNTSHYPFMWYQNICRAFFRFVTKHTCDRRQSEKL